MPRLRSILTFALCLALTPAVALAGGTHTFEAADYGELDRGETEGAAIESSGKVTVGFLPQRGEVDGTTAFTCLPDGGSVLIGTADKATIARVYPSKLPKSRASKKSKADASTKPLSNLRIAKVAELEGVVVSALAPLPGGDVVAAALPGGNLYRVGSKGKVSKFATLKVDQIWGLMVHKDRLLVATGGKGELFSLSMSGKDPKVVLDVDDKNILSMQEIGGNVVVGTSPQAKLFQVSDDLAGVLLHDFNGDEIRAMAPTKTGLAVAINNFSDRKLTTLDALNKTLNRSSLAGQPSSGALSSGRPPDAEAKVFHVDLGPARDLARASEAPWELWLSRDKQYFTSLLSLGGTTVLVGSSAGGKVYRVRGPRDVATVADLEERQTTALCQLRKSKAIFATAAHGAAVYQLQAAPAHRARYRTRVFDAGHPAAYGALVLRGEGPLKVRARTGPTDEPNARWSDWSALGLSRGGAELRTTLAKLAHRRYAQVEVSLGSPDAQLRALELFYAPENLAPLLQAIDVARPGFDSSDEREPKSNVTIKWKVDARDDDDLVYDVRVRPEGSGEAEWIPLHKSDELVTKRQIEWDLTTIPDGVYEIGVKASDEPTNGSANARTDEMVSAPFVVDRQRPTLDTPKLDKGKIRGKATDKGGYIHDVAFSIDGGPFRTASAADGLFDSPTETYEITLPTDLQKGKHRIVVRVRDSFGNLASQAAIITR